MMKQAGIYMITNTVNGKKYIGQSNWLKKRIGAHLNHLRNGAHSNIHLQRSFNKYGEGAFDFSIIEYCDEERLNEREIYYIKLYDTFRNGYNQTEGGEGNRGYKFSDNSKQLMSESHYDCSGKNNPMFGKSWKEFVTEDVLQHHNQTIRESLLANPPVHNETICLNDGKVYNSAAEAARIHKVDYWKVMLCCTEKRLYGYVNSEDEPIVFAYLDDYNSMDSNEIEAKINMARSHILNPRQNQYTKRVVNITTGKEFDSIVEAGKYYNINPSYISGCLSSAHLSAGKDGDGTKYVWVDYERYVSLSDEEIKEMLERAQNACKSTNNCNAKGVLCITTNKYFPTISEASSEYHVDPSGIVKCCKGKAKSCGKHNGEKLTWRYAS